MATFTKNDFELGRVYSVEAHGGHVNIVGRVGFLHDDVIGFVDVTYTDDYTWSPTDLMKLEQISCVIRHYEPEKWDYDPDVPVEESDKVKKIVEKPI